MNQPTSSDGPAVRHLDHPARGAFYMLGAALAFSSMAVLIRRLSPHLPDEVLVFWRSFFSLLFLGPWLLSRSPKQLATRHIELHLMRAGTGLLSMYCLFFAIGHAHHIAEALLFNQTATLFVPFLAYFLLGEQVAPKVRWAIAIGFTGVVLVLKPGIGIVSWPALVGLASGLTAAFSVVTIRYSSRTEPAVRIVFYFCLFATLGSALPLPWVWVTPSWGEVPWLLAIGALATAGQLLMTRGYAAAPAAQIGPFTYSSIVFGVFFGWWFWGEAPGWRFWIGAALIVAGGVMALRGEALAAVLRPAGRTPDATGARDRT